MHRIVKLPDTRYWIFGQNVTLVSPRISERRQFLRVEYPNRIQRKSSKKKSIEKKIVILQ